MNTTTEYEEEFEGNESIRVRVTDDSEAEYPFKIQFINDFNDVTSSEDFDLGGLTAFIKLLNAAKRKYKEV